MAKAAKADKVQLEASVVFEITRHLHDHFPGTAGGVLLGTHAEDRVQVTESFPLPASAFEGDGAHLRSQDTLNYRTRMVKMLEKVGADASIEGWYLSSSLGAIYSPAVLDNMYAHQQQNPEAVLLVHDVALSRATGSVSLRALRLSEHYLAVKQEGRWSTEALVRNELAYSDILQELPVYIHNSQLVNLLTLSADTPALDNNRLAQLQVPDQHLIEAGIEDVLEGIDDFNYDQGNYNYYQRHLVREKQKVQQWQQKRAQENRARDASNKSLLPTDEWKTLFRMPEEPSRHENLLVSAQLDEYCGQIEELSAISRTTLK